MDNSPKKKKNYKSLTNKELNQILIDRAIKGRTVLKLKQDMIDALEQYDRDHTKVYKIVDAVKQRLEAKKSSKKKSPKSVTPSSSTEEEEPLVLPKKSEKKVLPKKVSPKKVSPRKVSPKKSAKTKKSLSTTEEEEEIKGPVQAKYIVSLEREDDFKESGEIVYRPNLFLFEETSALKKALENYFKTIGIEAKPEDIIANRGIVFDEGPFDQLRIQIVVPNLQSIIFEKLNWRVRLKK